MKRGARSTLVRKGARLKQSDPPPSLTGRGIMSLDEAEAVGIQVTLGALVVVHVVVVVADRGGRIAGRIVGDVPAHEPHVWVLIWKIVLALPTGRHAAAPG